MKARDKESKPTKEYKCTECGEDATIAYGGPKKEGDRTRDGQVKFGERLCLLCGRKRGLKFFG